MQSNYYRATACSHRLYEKQHAIMNHYNAISAHNEDESSPILTGTSLHPIVNENDQRLFNPNPQDHLTPCFDCPHGDRPSTIFIGTFNLIASIIGGVSSSRFNPPFFQM